MFINEEEKYIFIHVPKAAGSAIHIALKDHNRLVGKQRADPEPEIHHRTLEEVLLQEDRYLDFFTFSVVRNPWSRILSGYLDFVQNRGKNYSGKIILDKPLLSEYLNFKDFVMNFKDSKWNTDVHFKPQTLFTHSDKKNVDFIMKFERLESDYEKLCQKLGINEPLQKHRTTKHTHYSDYYDMEMIKEVEKYFSSDIEEYGYSFGDDLDEE
tara:strand:- start:266 stop:898 length:633 start_codon:yes stop_codon:yes gene_type:complete